MLRTIRLTRRWLGCVFAAGTAMAAAAEAGCGPGEGTAPMSLRFSSQEGTATLIGFREFAVLNQPPVVPPHTYRRREVSGEMNSGAFFDTACDTNNSSVSVDQSFSSDNTYDGHLEIVPIASTSTTVTYRINYSVTPALPLSERRVVLQFGWGYTYWQDGDTVSLERGWSADCYIQIYKWIHGGFVGMSPSRRLVAPRIESHRDAWNTRQQHDASSGLFSEVINSTRHRGWDYPLIGGTLVPTGPNLGYPTDDVTTTSSATTRTYIGNATCRWTGDRWSYFTGTVRETLSDPDTEEDAEKRANTHPGSSNIVFRTLRTDLSFEFRRTRATARFKLCPGEYNLVLHYTEAAHGSVTPGVQKRHILKPLRVVSNDDVEFAEEFRIGAVPFTLKNTDYTITNIVAEPIGCSTSEPGGSGFSVGSVRFWMNLGRQTAGFSAGQIRVDAESFGPELFTPASLTVAADLATETIRDAAGRVRQVWAPQTLADVVTLDATSYEVRFYSPAQVGAPDPLTLVHSVTGTPFVTYRLDNPDAPQGAATRLRIIEIRGTETKTSHFSFEPATGWALSQAGGLRQESEIESTVNGEKVRTKTVRNAANHIVGRSARAYRQFAWGEEMVREILDPEGAALTTTFEFYDSVPASNPNYRQLRQRTGADGSWERFTYDVSGRVLKSIRPFLDAPPSTTDEALCRVTEYVHDTIPDADGDGISEARTLTIDRTLGRETARRYRIDWSKSVTLGADPCTRHSEVVCMAAGAAWDAADNLVTETLRYSSGILAGRDRRVVNPDGTATLTTHNLAANGVLTSTIATGQPNAARDAIVDGRRTVTVTDAKGQVTSEQVSDIASGRSLTLWVATQFDALGRPTRLDHDDGTYVTRNYACCDLASERDRFGIVTTYDYDALGRQTLALRSGIGIRTDYDAEGRVTAVVRIGTDGSTTTQRSSAYDVAGRLREQRDARQRLTTFAESFSATTGNTTRTTTHPDGGTVIEVTARDGSRLSSGGTAAAAHAFDYGADALGTFVKHTRIGSDASGQPTTTEWVTSYTDFAGRPLKTVFADGAQQQSFYNAAGQLVRQVDPDGVTTLYAYNPRGEQDTVAIDMNANGLIDFAGPDRITRTLATVAERPEGASTHLVQRTTTQTWETDNQDTPAVAAISEHSADGRRTWQTIRGLTTSTLTASDGSGGRTVTSTAPDGTITEQVYSHDRLVSTVVRHPALGALGSTTYAHDPHGRIQSSTDARNGTASFTYFADDQLHTITTPDPDPAQTGPGYDPQTTTYGYDAAGRVTSVTQPDGGTLTTTYWPTGAVRRISGTRTYPVEYTYDPQGRMKTLTTWRDFAGDSGKSVTTWNYHPQRGWLDSKRYADNTGPAYAYTPAGRLRTRTWARTPVITATYSYNPAGDLTATDYSDTTPDVTLAYDRAGRPRTITDGSGARTLGYHVSGQLEDETYTSGFLSGFAVDRSFDSQHRLSGLSVPTVPSVVYNYDSASRLDTVTSGASTTNYAYLTHSTLVETITFKNSGTPRLATTKAYDKLNRLSSVTNALNSQPPSLSYSYTYNAANQRTRATRENQDYWSYAYDPLGQVTSAQKRSSANFPLAGHDFAWTFDDIGNRTSETKNAASSTYAANALNQYTQRTVPGVVDVSGAAAPAATVTVAVNNGLPQPVTRQGESFFKQLTIDNATSAQSARLTITGVTANAGPNGEDAVTQFVQTTLLPKSPEIFAHDADGNLLADGRWSYTWDGENRLVAIETAPGAAAAGVPRRRLEFAYDGQSRRIAKKKSNWNGSAWVLASHTLFLYDGWNLLAEFAVTSPSPLAFTLTRSYVWGLDLSGSFQGAGGVGGLLSVTDHSSLVASHFACHDGNGNVTALIAAADGNPTAQYDYTAFGEPVLTEGTFANANPFRFSTKYTDNETGHLYYGYRCYAPETGRWLSRDPYGEEGGENLHQFVANAPTSWCDPLGLALYAFDGTNNDGDRDRWDNLKAGNGPTNVKILYDIYEGENAFYAHGVGTRDGILNPLGLAGGLRGKSRVRDALQAAEEFISRGDTIADIIGFSRGAATARDFANQLKQKFPCVRIRWIGIFDTVPSFGLGGNDIDLGYNFSIPTGTGSVFHITAGGERRYFFPLMSINVGPYQRASNPNYTEISIPGAVHSDIGGGYRDNRGIANFALGAMWRDGRRHNVPFGEIPAMYLNYAGPPHDSRWRNDKIVEAVIGGPRQRKVFYAP